MTLIGALAALSGCSGGDQKNGTACAVDGDCASPNTCHKDLPGGYCTQTCSRPGQTCGTGSVVAYCAKNGGTLRCSAYCTSNADCRAGYTCEDVPGTSNPSLPGSPPYQACIVK
jgi:hypothetical protein